MTIAVWSGRYSISKSNDALTLVRPPPHIEIMNDLSADPTAAIDLAVTGMTCASCSSRIEKVLTRLPGVVRAEVNLATEKARVSVLKGGVSATQLVAAIEKAGFGAALVTTEDSPAKDDEKAADQSRRDLAQIWLAALFTFPLVGQMLFDLLLGGHAMLPPVAQLLLACPVQFVIGARFYVGAWKSLRSGSGLWHSEHQPPLGCPSPK